MMLFNLHVVITNRTDCFIREYYEVYIELFMVLDTWHSTELYCTILLCHLSAPPLFNHLEKNLLN